LDIEHTLVASPRSRTRRAATLCALAFGAAAFTPASAHAQGQAPATPSPEDIASARALGIEGVRLADAGDCVSAVPKLQAAENLYHAPSTLERLGECEVSIGHVVAGTEALNRVVHETLPPTAPSAFVAAQQRATQVLATAQPRIGKLRIHVDGAPADKVSVTVDGAAVPAALFDAERATDPGTHEVQATAVGYRTATSSVEVPPGADAAVWLKLDVDPNAGAVPPPPPPLGSTPAQTTMVPPPNGFTPEAATTGPNRVPAYIAFGLGGAGIAVGAVFGILALGTKSTLDNECPNKVCAPSAKSDVDNLSTRATISNVAFAVGAVGVAAGIVLFVTARGSEAPKTASARPPLYVSPWIGLGAAGLGGTFE
jgi:hypothetical protein